MDIFNELQNELDYEYEVTKKFLERFPEDKNEFKPHNKSMPMKTLTNHIVEIFAWPKAIMETEHLDFGKGGYQPSNEETKQGLLKKLDDDYKKGKDGIAQLTNDNVDNSWDIRQDDTVFNKWSKYGAIRHSLNQIAHHRAQLDVCYRLNDIPVSGSYWSSANDESF